MHRILQINALYNILSEEFLKNDLINQEGLEVPHNYRCKYALTPDLTMYSVPRISLMLFLPLQAIYSTSRSSSAHKSALGHFFTELLIFSQQTAAFGFKV